MTARAATLTKPAENVDQHEIAHFDRIGQDWWDRNGSFRTLHDINPVRLDFIRTHVPLVGAQVVDVGCGGGILAEAMRACGADVLGIDMSEAALAAAEAGAAGVHGAAADPVAAGVHGAAADPVAAPATGSSPAHGAGADSVPAPETAGGRSRYRCTTAEALAAQGQRFDVVTCLEMLEHVPDPDSVIQACARLCRPGGHVFFSTINRTPRAWALAVLGAEYVLRLLPRGTHDYAKFLRPSELDAAARAADLDLIALRGMHYDPLTRRARLTADVGVNYLACYANATAESPA